MKKKMILLLGLIIIFITGCTADNGGGDFESYMNNVDLSSEYKIYQLYDNSGFAEIQAEREQINYTLGDDEGYSVSQIKDMIYELNFNQTPLQVDKNKYCFLGEQWGVYASIVCFEKDMIIYFQRYETKGNHQKINFIWRQNSFDLFEYKCIEDKSIFCPVFVRGFDYVPDICNYYSWKKEYCESVLNIG